jgi:hypothetical protein
VVRREDHTARTHRTAHWRVLIDGSRWPTRQIFLPHHPSFVWTDHARQPTRTATPVPGAVRPHSSPSDLRPHPSQNFRDEVTARLERELPHARPGKRSDYCKGCLPSPTLPPALPPLPPLGLLGLPKVARLLGCHPLVATELPTEARVQRQRLRAQQQRED